MVIARRQKDAAEAKINGRLGRGHGVGSPSSLVDEGRGARAALVVNRASICAIVLSVMLVVTGCGGGGSKVKSQAAVMPQVQNPPPPACPPGQVGTPPTAPLRHRPVRRDKSGRLRTAPLRHRPVRRDKSGRLRTAPLRRLPAGTSRDASEPPLRRRQNCIPLHDGTCASIGDFNTQAQQLAGEYRLEDPFKNQWGLETIGADSAYAYVNLLKGENTAPGSGVTIGFMDSGIDTSHAMFEGKTVTEVFMSGATDETGQPRYSHGTAVASVAAGVHASSTLTSPQGVARGADIAMFAVPTGSGGGNYNPISLAGLSGASASWAQEINQVLSWRNGQKRVDILNLSIGYKGLIDGYSEADLRANFGQAISAMAQAGASEKAILVWAAGNAHGKNCDPAVMTSNCVGGTVDPPVLGTVDAVSVEIMPGLAARIAELRGHTIAVAALKPGDERITGFSNRCGIAANYCIAAPGQTVRAAYFGPDPNDNSMTIRGIAQNLDGTSFAAPMVAGSLAIMKQLFRDQLSNTELVTRLFETADDTGVYSNRAIYGRGKLDLAAATHPVGVLEIPMNTNTNQAGSSPGATRLSMGTPFGNGLARSVGNHEIMAVDDLGAPFWYRLGDFVATAKGPPVDARVRGFLADTTGSALQGSGVRIQNTSAEAGGGHLSLAEGGMMATFAGQGGLSASVFGTNQEHDAVGGTLNWRPDGSPLGLRLGWITEDETILGGEGQGAFGTFAADTAFLRLEGDVRLGAWRLGASAEWGSVRPKARGGLIEEVSSMTTSAFALHARAAVTDTDVVRFSLAQPLRVEDGQASLTLPVARTKYGRVLRISLASPLAPDERQIDIAANWERPLADGQLRLGVIWSHNPGHSGDAEPQLTFLAGWRRAF